MQAGFISVHYVHDYMNEKVTVEELLCNLDTISKEFPCDSDLVYDKMFFELTKMMES